LLLNGGDPWIHDSDGNNAFHYAYKEQHWNIIELLQSVWLTDSYKEEDSNKEKYILTFGKLYIQVSPAIVRCFAVASLPKFMVVRVMLLILVSERLPFCVTQLVLFHLVLCFSGTNQQC
jgi:hypothetical protein